MIATGDSDSWVVSARVTLKLRLHRRKGRRILWRRRASAGPSRLAATCKWIRVRRVGWAAVHTARRAIGKRSGRLGHCCSSIVADQDWKLRA